MFVSGRLCGASLRTARRCFERGYVLGASGGERGQPERKEVQVVNGWKRASRVDPDRSEVRQGHALYKALHDYQHHYRRLLTLQRGQDEVRLRERLRWPVERQVEEGYTVTRLMSYFTTERTSHDKTICVLKKPPTTEDYMNWHRFSPGDPVYVTPEDVAQTWKGPEEDTGGKEEFDDPVTKYKDSFQGTVVESSRYEIMVEFDTVHNTDGLWRIEMALNDVVYRRLEEALRSLHLDIASQKEASTAEEQVVLTGTGLRDVILEQWQCDDGDNNDNNNNNRSIASRNTRTDLVAASTDDEILAHLDHRSTSGIFASHTQLQDWVTRHLLTPPQTLPTDPYLDLNPSQIRAIAIMFRERVSLIQGPPGTGKTHTIISAIKLLKSHFKVKQPILVVAATNAAVDNLMAGLQRVDLNVVRCGAPSRVRADLKDNVIEARLKMHPLYSEYLTRVKKALQYSIYQSGTTTTTKTTKKTVRRKNETKTQMWADCKALKNRMLQDILLGADAVCSTCVGSASALLKTVDFPIVFHDEGGMSTEPMSIVPLMKGCEHLAMIGDHKQLPPVVTSLEALAGGLGISLFERLIRERRIPSVLLSTQYRMHPLISEFPNKMFYSSKLDDGTLKDGHIIPNLIAPSSQFLKVGDSLHQDPLAPKPVAFVSHHCQQTYRNCSYTNRGEAELVLRIIVDLLSRNSSMNGNDIGVIAPYAGQVNLLHTLFRLATHGSDRKNLSEGDRWAMDYAYNELDSHRAAEIANVEIRTIDGFEGREKNVVIFSTVRSNASGHIGFLADTRRHNVGLTRAKRGLIVVGNQRTLENSRTKAAKTFITSSFSTDIDQAEWAHQMADMMAAPKPLTVSTFARSTSSDDQPDLQVDPVVGTIHPFLSISREEQRRTDGAEAWKRYISWLEERDLIVQWPHLSTDVVAVKDVE